MPVHNRTQATRLAPAWFAKDALRFFSGRIGTFYATDDGAYFTTSERKDWRSPRLYTVRHITDEGTVSTVGEFQGYESSYAARKAAKALWHASFQRLPETPAERATADEMTAQVIRDLYARVPGATASPRPGVITMAVSQPVSPHVVAEMQERFAELDSIARRLEVVKQTTIQARYYGQLADRGENISMESTPYDADGRWHSRSHP
jgi:hypothetical protein